MPTTVPAGRHFISNPTHPQGRILFGKEECDEKHPTAALRAPRHRPRSPPPRCRPGGCDPAGFRRGAELPGCRIGYPTTDQGGPTTWPRCPPKLSRACSYRLPLRHTPRQHARRAVPRTDSPVRHGHDLAVWLRRRNGPPGGRPRSGWARPPSPPAGPGDNNAYVSIDPVVAPPSTQAAVALVASGFAPGEMVVVSTVGTRRLPARQ